MQVYVNDRTIETNDQGYLCNLNDWSEDYVETIAKQDGIDLYNDHWELILYFRDYYRENETCPTMHKVIRSLGSMKGKHFHNQKEYEKHIYSLFPQDPTHEVCKLAGLPMPPPDT